MFLCFRAIQLRNVISGTPISRSGFSRLWEPYLCEALDELPVEIPKSCRGSHSVSSLLEFCCFVAFNCFGKCMDCCCSRKVFTQLLPHRGGLKPCLADSLLSPKTTSRAKHINLIMPMWCKFCFVFIFRQQLRSDCKNTLWIVDSFYLRPSVLNYFRETQQLRTLIRKAKKYFFDLQLPRHTLIVCA